MADPNALPNKELEDLNAKIREKVQNVLKNIDTKSINQEVKTKIDAMNLSTSNVEVGDDEKWTGTAFIPNRRYVDSLPKDYKEKVYLYYDIFRDNPELVSDYVETLKKNGSEKAAKEAGTSNVLFYPKKLKKYIKANAENFDENTEKRWEYYDYFGDHNYNIQIREDDFGRAYQKEWLGKKWTKTKLGAVEAVGDSARFLTKTIAEVVAAVGPENASNAVEWIEANWPRADDIQYQNKLRPFAQDSLIQNMADEVTKFGISTLLGAKLLKALGWGATKVAPGTAKKITDWYIKRLPAKTKAGKEIADSFGNIKYASSIAQKAGGWGLPIAVKYGLGRTLTSETVPGEKHTETFAEGFGFMPTLTREQYEKMTGKEKAIYSLKKKLIHGAEGTVLIGGLTKAIGRTGHICLPHKGL
jgi:hypothetical protein